MTLIIICQKYEGKSYHVSRRITTLFSGVPGRDNNIVSTSKALAKRRFFHETGQNCGRIKFMKSSTSVSVKF